MKNEKNTSKDKEKRNDTLFWIITGLLITIVIITLFVLNSKPSKVLSEESIDYNQVIVNNQGCEDNYLGICYDEDSLFYKCNLIDGFCNKDDADLVDIIKYLEENNIRIYGLTTCPHCKDEFSEFGKYGQSVLDRGIFTFCDINWTDGCNNLEAVPSWRKNGIVVDIGYMKLTEIRI
ncbi:MAG: hypothetical protein WC346_04550 [Methanogenium sp.]|jgi:hypothetical protein